MRRTTILATLFVLVLAGTASADGFLVPRRAELPVRGPYAVKDHRVKIRVDGQQAETEVRQTFTNLTRGDLEVSYLFPVPEGAVLDGFSLVVGGKEMKGEILPAADAVRIYEAIVRSKRDPGLLTYAGRGLVRTRVFPIPAGGSREVIVRYSELLRRDGDLVRLVYPLDTERFSAQPIEVVSVDVDITSRVPIRAVYSPSHDVRVERPSENRARASWTGERILPDRDLTLYYSVGVDDVGASVLSYFPKGADAGHFLLLLSPRAEVDEGDVVPKDLVLVLDRSGSMKGRKIEQAKEALRYVLESLGPRDRLNIVAFSSTVETLFPEPRPVTEAVRKLARSFVFRLDASGGTDIHSALQTALAGLHPDPERRNTILFLTDGLPTVGQQDVGKIAADVTRWNEEEKGARLFVFGVGHDVNAPFLDRLVEENGGVSENVDPDENVEIAVTGLYRKIEHAVLTDLLVRVLGVETFDVYPRRIPDLFAGSQLVVTGRYRGGGPGSAIVAGRVGGRKHAFRFPLRFETASDPDEKPFVARVWATMKIGFLLDQMRVLDRREPELVDEIVRLSVRYGIVTEYTAFLADETNDFRAFSSNRARAQKEIEGRVESQTGAWGTTQAKNVKGMRARQQADVKSQWLDRNGKLVEVATVRNIGRKTFYRRGGEWIDRDVAEGEEPVEVVTQMSPRFFELVRGQRAAQNRWLAVSEPVVVRLDGRVIKFVPGE